MKQRAKPAPHLVVTVYRPNQRHALGFLRTWSVMARSVWSAKGLIWQLFRRDFTAGYKKSYVGMAWLVVAPLMGILSWVFFQMTGVLAPGNMDVPYPVYVMLGTTMWGFFMGMFSAAQSTLGAGSSLVLQVNYPHEALLFQQTAQQLITSAVALAGNLCVMCCFGVVPSWGTVLLPLVLVPLFLVAAGIGLLASMISIVAVDLTRIVNMGMGLLMYLTPVIYSSDKMAGKFVGHLVNWNPLTHLVCSARDMVLYGRLYDPVGYYASAAMSLVVFMLSWRLFYVCEDKLIERMV